MTGLIAVGAAILRVIGLNPQSVTQRSESRVPGKPTFGGMDYQLTGLDEKLTTIEAETWPHVTGGLDALLWLEEHHRDQTPVNLIRLQANYLGRMEGRVVIRSIEREEERFHPFSGVGRRINVVVELVHVEVA